MLIAAAGTNSRIARTGERRGVSPTCDTPVPLTPRMTEFIQVLTTTDARARAEEIASHLVEQRLAACVQIIGPINSVFRWEDKIDTAEEWLCLAKTRADLFAEVEAAIRAKHTYQVPEILALPISAGHAAYLSWLDGEVRGEIRGRKPS